MHCLPLKFRPAITCVVLYALCSPLLTSAETGLHIVTVAGDKAVNDLKRKNTVKPVIEVRDASDRPVKGAVVTFTTPGDGPGVVFDNDLRSVSLVTDDQGQVTPANVTAVNAGSFQYDIRATYQQQIATATIGQTNMPDANAANSPPANARRKFPRWVLAAILGGAAAGAGVGLALGMQSSNKITPAVPTATIGTGSGATAGAPH